jgi:hypothetical protein
VGLNLVSSNILDGNGFLTMPRLISVPNSGSFEKKQVAQLLKKLLKRFY